MTRSLDELVRRLHAIVDARVALALPNGVGLEVERGTVDSVVPSLRVAMVRLGGNTTPVPVAYPALPVAIAAGDEVVVQRRRDGWLMVDHVLGRDAAAAAGGAHPDLATHDALGLATDAELSSAVAAHAATPHGFPNPMTTRGDLIVRDASAPARLAVGTVGRFLRSDGTDPGWAYPAVGWLPYAYPIGITMDQASGSASTLAAVSGGNAGAGACAILVSAPMALQSVTIRNGDTASARAAEFRLYRDDGSATLAFITGTDGTLSFTPGAASDRTANVSSPGVLLVPGVYWLVLRNTSASQTFAYRRVASTELAGNVFAQVTTASVAALGSTIDLTSWTFNAFQFMARLNGRVFGQAAAF